MAYGAGDPLSPRLVTAIRRPIQCSWLHPQSPYVARRIVVVLSGKAARYVERLALLYLVSA